MGYKNRPCYVKAFVDPDLEEEWKKFRKKYPYLFWVRAMNIKNEEEWWDFIKSREPDLGKEPVRPENAAEFSNISEARRNLYFHLARSFSEPSRALVDFLINQDFPSAMESALRTFVGEGRTKEGLELLREYIRIIKSEGQDWVLERLRAGHLTIFYDSFFPWLSCYESVYRGEKQIMGELTAMVNDSYRKAGFALTGEYGNDPPDDAKIELEFMYRLCENELEAWRKGDRKAALGFLEMQKQHLHQHMIEWIPYLCDDLLKPEFRKGVLEKFHRTIKPKDTGVRAFDFYRAVGAITKGVLECDYNQIQAMLETGMEINEGEVSSHLRNTGSMDTKGERFALVKSC